MEDIIDIIVTETTNLIEITSQPTDEIIDVNIIDNREDVTLNITPTLVEININSLTGNFGILWGEIEGTLSNQTDLQNVLNLKADLVDGKVPSSQLPSYVDDVVEVANYATLPVTGEVGKIYITLDTNFIYRWTGSTYVEIKDSSAVWGAITGTLSSQTDLQSALDAKQDDLNGTGFVKASGTTISYDNSTYLTTTAAASTYLPLTGGTLTGGLNGTFGNFSSYVNAQTIDISNSTASNALRITHTNGSYHAVSIIATGNSALYASGNVTVVGAITSTGVISAQSGLANGIGQSFALPTTSGTLALTSQLSAYLPLGGGTMTGNLYLPANNTVGGTNYFIGQVMATNDNWKIYGNTVEGDKGEMIFDVGDNGTPFDTGGQRFRFFYSAGSDGTAKSPLIIDYNTSTFSTSIVATSATFTGALSGTSATFNGKVLTTASGNDTFGFQMYKSGTTTTLAGFYQNTTGDGLIAAYNSAGTQNVQIATNGVSYFNGGNVGIGTTAPTAPVANRTAMVIRGGSNGAELNLQSTSATDGTSVGFALVAASSDAYYVNRLDGAHIWLTGGGGNSERMRITSSGNVGIGTSSPTAFSGYTTLTIDNTSGSFTEYRQGGTNTFRVGSNESSGGFLYTQGSTPIRLGTQDTERMRITSAGSVLVGTTSDNGAGKLQVDGLIVGSTFASSQTLTVNANNEKKSGMYRWNDSSTNLPEAGFFSVVIYGNCDNVVAQMATHFQNANTYVRAFNTSWTAWRRII